MVNARASCGGELEFKTLTAKSYTALQTVRHCFNIFASSCVAWRYDADMGTTNSFTLRFNTASIMNGPGKINKRLQFGYDRYMNLHEYPGKKIN